MDALGRLTHAAPPRRCLPSADSSEDRLCGGGFGFCVRSDGMLPGFRAAGGPPRRGRRVPAPQREPTAYVRAGDSAPVHPIHLYRRSGCVLTRQVTVPNDRSVIVNLVDAPSCRTSLIVRPRQLSLSKPVSESHPV